jgi:uncharacterized membrane protein YccF (DUF307 family)
MAPWHIDPERSRRNTMRVKLTNLRQRWDQARLKKSAVLWIVIGGVILTLYLGFYQAGWVTAGTANRMVAISSQEAVTERLAPICLAQFNQDPLRAQKLDEFKALTTTSQRTRFVSDHAWSIMPGELAADSKVAAECGRQLLALDG